MKKKTIALAGATGMIGRAVAERLKDHRIIPLTRGDFTLEEREFVQKYQSADVIINFAGAPILQRWSEDTRKKILESRTGTTRKIGSILEKGIQKERMYIGASAIGIYSNEGIHREDSESFGKGFVADVVRRWEQKALKLQTDGCPVSILRIGVVLSRKGGMMKKLLPLFRMGLGGRIGSGQQAFSWIHLDDLTRAVEHIMEQNSQGIYNLVSPNPCSNLDFTRALGRAMKKPAFLSVPPIALRILYGEGVELVTGGQTVLPDRLIRESFRFKFPELSGALQDIVN